MNDPPPATAFWTPAQTPANASKTHVIAHWR
jgi:hypothetical protein